LDSYCFDFFVQFDGVAKVKEQEDCRKRIPKNLSIGSLFPFVNNGATLPIRRLFELS
jgi:hypothetical protein